MSIECSSMNEVTVPATSKIVIPNFISIGGKTIVSATFEIKDCPPELLDSILNLLQKNSMDIRGF